MANLIYASGHPRDPRDFELPRPSIFQQLVPRAIPTTWVPGLDISRYQTDEITDTFSTLKAAGWQFIFIQATYGTTGVDYKFDRFWRAALDAGLWPIPYHFYYASYDGYIQAAHFLRTTDAMRNATGIQAGMVDVEARDGVAISTRLTRLNNWWTGVRSHAKVITYSSPALWQELTGNASLNTADYGMVAHWTSANAPAIPGGWTAAQTKYWQRGVYTKHSWITQPPGVEEDVDVDFFMGTMDELRAFLGVPLPPPPVDDHAEIWAKLIETDDKIGILSNMLADHDTRITALENKEPIPTPTRHTYFQVVAPVTNARRIKELNAAGRPIMIIYPFDGAPTSQRVQYNQSENVVIDPMMITADGGGKYYKISNSPVAGVDLYLRGIDGNIVQS